MEAKQMHPTTEDEPKTYNLISCKGNEVFRGTLKQAMRAAVSMNDELQPAFGVRVERADDGVTMYEVE